MLVYLTYILIIYLIFCKAWPYFLYPNYFKKSKIENYPELAALALKLKGDSKFQTIENVHRYMWQTYSGNGDAWRLKSLLSVFWLGDFSTEKILNKKQFLWCHAQNKLFKSILVNTGMFNESEVIVQKRFLTSPFIHQWIVLEADDKKITLDPYYNIFKHVNSNPSSI